MSEKNILSLYSTIWKDIFLEERIDRNIAAGPVFLSMDDIWRVSENYGIKRKRRHMLCKQDSRESRPQVFIDNHLFILPVKNGSFAVVKGEGYLNIPEVRGDAKAYTPQLGFVLETSKIGDSEMQHLDFAYASSIIRTFMDDPSLVLTIRGRKYTPSDGFDFRVGNQKLQAKSVQTEVDAGYEGRDQVVLVEAKKSGTKNVIIRQLFYPFRQWSSHTKKKVVPLFFEERAGTFTLWEFRFKDPEDYNSVEFVRAAKYRIDQ